MFNKDVVVPGRMRRKILNPRILLLDCPLEYKKGENQTNVEITKEEDWAALLKAEEETIRRQCDQASQPLSDASESNERAAYLLFLQLSASRSPPPSSALPPQIIAFKPDVVITEKGLSDLAAHFFTKAGISAIRRLRKTDNNRIARACGATIVNR